MKVPPEQGITPDQYELFTYTKDNLTTYHIFASWKGGYLHGDSWRRSSPIVRVEDADDYWSCYTQSGSQYSLHKDGRGVTGYNATVLASMIDMYKDSIDIVTIEQFLEGV